MKNFNETNLRYCNRQDFKFLNAEKIWETKVSSPPSLGTDPET